MPRRWPAKAVLPCALLLAAACGADRASDRDATGPDAADTWSDASRDTRGDPDADPRPVVTPDAGPAFGHFAVEIDLAETGIAPVDVSAARFGGVAAYDLRASGDTLIVVVQGAPEGGSVPLELDTTDGTVAWADALRYDAPAHPALRRVYAVGASLTQGVQRGVPSFHGSLMSPPAQVARQAGAWFPMPLLHPGLFPQIEPEDLGPAPECRVPNVVDFVTRQAAAVIPLLTSGEPMDFGYQYARVDPPLEVANLAVGSSSVAAVLDRPPEDDRGANFVAHLVYDPYGGFLQPIEQSQMDVLEASSPTLIMTTDLFGNDVVWAILKGDTIELQNATPEADLVRDTERAIDRLAATGAEVFVADLPRPSLLPATDEKRRTMAAAGIEDVEERIAAIEALADAANRALRARAELYENVHVVGLEAAVDELSEHGIDVEGTTFTTRKLGGLIGIDGVHFTDTGYAFTANVFIDAINAEMGTNIPLVDVAAVGIADIENPAALGAAGFDVEACYR